MTRKEILPDSALLRMGTLLAAVREAENATENWRASARIHVLRNYTTEPLDPFLRFHLLREDVRVEISHGGYGTMVQEVVDPHSVLVQEPPNSIVLALLLDHLDPRCLENGWQPTDAVAQLESVIRSLLEKLPSVIIASRFTRPIVDIQREIFRADVLRGVEALNRCLESLARQAPDQLVLVDIDGMITDIGPPSIDTRFWKSSQAPFSRLFLDRYARRIAGYVRAAVGLTKKCLVLDCDNTLWGGVIGEDGIDGIALGETTEAGGYFRDFQAKLLELHERGIMLALCSKNNEKDVWEVLENHPDCLLKKSHLVGWRVNWQDKATNLISLVRELNIGMDSVVFLDDSPHERQLVGQALPDVTVLGVPENLEHYPSLLERDGWFEVIRQTSEDLNRTRMYRDEAERKSQRNEYTDLTSYLRSLETVLRITRMRETDVARVGQLTRKTNQFNLTTRRYSDDEIRALSADKNAAIFTMSVSDRYGDMGLTGVLIAKRCGKTVNFDTLLLSCRVLGRRLEHAFVDQCMMQIERAWDPELWVAEYIPSAKNAQVADFWPKAGFDRIQSDAAHELFQAHESCMDRDYLNIIDVRTEF